MSGGWQWSPRALLLSEPVAWAVQNGIGVLCSTLFLTVVGLRFMLACTVAIFACVALLLLSPDRSAGGRIFAAAAFAGNIFCGMVLGGALVSLAFLARGAGQEPLISYLPKSLQTLGSFPQEEITKIQDGLSSAFVTNAVAALPPDLQELIDRVAKWGEKELESILPEFGGGFWALLIILPIIVLVPLAMGRSRAQGSAVLLTMMSTLMMGVIMSFGWMTQILTLRLYWSEIVLGFIYAILASAACSLFAGCLVYVRSSHDEVRASAAVLVQEAGTRISKLSSSLLDTSKPPETQGKPWPSAEKAAAAPPSAAGEAAAPADPSAATNAPLPTDVFGERDLQELEARLKWVLEPGSREAAAALEAVEARPLEAFSMAQQEMARFERSLGLAAVEPPWPGLCSQPGADLAPYQALKREMELLGAAIVALRAACGGGRLTDVGAATGLEAEQLGKLQTAMAQGLGLAAAACARAAEALACMPALGPCYGPELPWRPVDAATWGAHRAELARVTNWLVDLYRSGLQADGLDFALSVDSRKGRALLFTIPMAIQLMWHVQDMEAAVAAALWVPTAPSQAAADTPDAAAAADGSGKDPTVDVECGKQDLESGSPAAEIGATAMAANGVVSGGAAGGIAAPPAAAPVSLPLVPARLSPATQAKRNRLGPYVKNAVTLVALSSSLAAWAAFAKGIAEALSGLPAALSSRTAFAQAIRRPHNQFAFKFWLGLSLSMMGMMLFTWKVPRPFNVISEANLFFNWQPMYFWMAACIVIQPSVEGSISRGMMRVGGVFLGAMLGLAAGSNGRLLNNPYYLSGMVVLLTAFFSLPAPVAEFRYTLCMVAYTATAVMVCTYVGCCAEGTTWLSMAGKAVPTALGGVWGLIVIMILPNFASNEILAEQASILREAFACMETMFAEHRSAALERRPPNLSPSLVRLESCASRITAVGARIGANTIDPRMLPVSALLLAMPRAVHMMQPALRSLTGSMLATICSCARVDTGFALPAPHGGSNEANGSAAAAKGGSGGTEGGEASAHGSSVDASRHSGKQGSKAHKRGAKAAATLQATPYAAASDYFCIFAENPEMQAAFEAVLEAHGALVEACAEDLERGRGAAGVEELRARTAKAATAAAESRLELQRRYSRLRPALLQRTLGLECGVGDMLALAFAHGFLMTTEHVLGVAQVLQAASAQRRENLGSWLQAWKDTRSQV